LEIDGHAGMRRLKGGDRLPVSEVVGLGKGPIGQRGGLWRRGMGGQPETGDESKDQHAEGSLAEWERAHHEVMFYSLLPRSRCCSVSRSRCCPSSHLLPLPTCPARSAKPGSFRRMSVRMAPSPSASLPCWRHAWHSSSARRRPIRSTSCAHSLPSAGSA